MNLPYPETRKDDCIEEIFGHHIADPYRWLEDPDSAATQQWVDQQRKFTENYLEQLPDRGWFQETMKQICLRARVGCPYRYGGKYYVLRNDGAQAQDVLFVADSLAELQTGGKVLLDPNTWASDGTASMSYLIGTDDGRYLAYARNEAGSDWSSLHVIDAETGQECDEPIMTRHAFPTWMPDHRSYVYVRPRTVDRAEGTNTDIFQPADLWLHRIGTSIDQDQLLWHNPAADGQLHAGTEVSADGRWLLIFYGEGTSRKTAIDAQPITMTATGIEFGERFSIFDNFDHSYFPIAYLDNQIIAHTDNAADRWRVVRFELTPKPELIELVAESDHMLSSAVPVGDKLLLNYLVDASPEFRLIDFEGHDHGKLDIAGGGLVSWQGKQDNPEGFIAVSSITEQARSYRVDADGCTAVALNLEIGPQTFSPPEISIERRRAVSADGVEAPYWLIKSTDAQPGRLPTLVWGYGGFSIPIAADYRPTWSCWLKAGGQIALCNLRGGGEFGQTWYDQGRLANKQNVFNDVIAIGEDLLAAGLADSNHLVIMGRSNGGLLAGAAMTQRPDLWQVSLPAVGVLDMLRFHRFTCGKAWVSDYGNPEVAADFEVALQYSPLHNVKEGIEYPATLIATGDHDDRVSPLHSHKFAATLQQAQAGSAPILERIEVATGHGFGKPLAMVAEENADLLAFAAYHTGLKPAQ